MTLPFSPPKRCAEACAGLFKYQESLRKQFCSVWSSCDARASLLSVMKELEGSFDHCGAPVKLVNPVYARKRPDKAVFTAN